MCANNRKSFSIFAMPSPEIRSNRYYLPYETRQKIDFHCWCVQTFPSAQDIVPALKSETLYNQQWTIFAPTDAAFLKAIGDLRALKREAMDTVRTCKVYHTCCLCCTAFPLQGAPYLVSLILSLSLAQVLMQGPCRLQAIPDNCFLILFCIQ